MLQGKQVLATSLQIFLLNWVKSKCEAMQISLQPFNPTMSMKMSLTSQPRYKDEKSSSARASCACRHRRRVPPRSHLAHPLMTEIAFCLSLSFPFPFSAAKPNRLQSIAGRRWRRRGRRWGNIISAASDRRRRRQHPPPSSRSPLARRRHRYRRRRHCCQIDTVQIYSKSCR